MPKRTNHSTGSELFIVDNSKDDWKVLRYLHDWCQFSKSIDIATGFFEIGSLLGLGDEWGKVDKIRILMGDEVSKRTKKAFERSLEVITTKLNETDFLQEDWTTWQRDDVAIRSPVRELCKSERRFPKTKVAPLKRRRKRRVRGRLNR